MITRKIAITIALLCSTEIRGVEFDTTRVDGVFEGFHNGPGCSVSISHGGQPIYSRGFGFSNLEHEIPISDKTRFLVGSTSKQFTAFAVAKLAEKGKLSLTDTLSKYFPAFPKYADKILISDLIHHTSGVRDIDHLTYLGGFGDSIDYTDEDAMMFLVRQQGLNFEPGMGYMYSNSNYFLLAKIVEIVTRKSFRHYTTENIFKPLHMNSTHFSDDHTEIIKLRATGYWPTESGFSKAFNTMDIVGASGLYTTNEDMNIWFRHFLKGLDTEKEANIFKKVSKPGLLRNGFESHYAFGLEVDTSYGMKRIHHGGGDAGYRAMSMMFPEHQISFGILCNNGFINTMELSQALTELVFGVTAPKMTPKQITHPIDSEKLGEYWNPEQKQRITLSEDNGSNFFQINNRKKQLIAHTAGTSYEVASNTGSPLTLSIMPNDLLIIESEKYGDSIISEYKKIKTNQPVELSKFAGEYFSRELDIRYLISHTNDGLLLNIKGSAPHLLAYVNGDTFSDKYGQIVLEFTDDGGFSLDSTRAKDISFEALK